MSVNVLDAKTIAGMLISGAAELKNQKETINELNVFPVPDGDTGTNMTLTITSAVKEVMALGDDYNMEALCKAISMGSLRGARGNSGVILSQLLRGFTKELKEHDEVTKKVIARSFNKACETAYKAVMKPKEGTILTVARGAAEKASETCDDDTDIETFAKGIIDHAEYVLSQTPEMLEVLKQAHVVDSGGQGLVAVLKGAYEALLGNPVEFTMEDASTGSGGSSGINRDAVANADIKFGYCTEFIIMLNRVFNAKNEKDFKAFLESIGDSIVCVAMDDIVKVHVHTNHPGLAFEKALTFGALTSMKIDNMREEHHERLFKLDNGKYVEKSAEELDQSGPAGTATGPLPDSKKESEKEGGEESLKERVKYGFIAVTVGQGLGKIFKELGADEIISGGQTMNPSTEDMINAIAKVNADNIFIFPNNKNIILTANQAASMTEDKNVIVIPTKTISQGVTALVSFIADQSPEENEANMKEEMKRVKSGEVTYAVRDTVIDDKEIKAGDYMGIGENSILSVGSDIEEVTVEMTGQLITEDDSLICIYYGEDSDEEKAEALSGKISERYPDLDVEVYSGGQPIYYYVISVE